MSATPFALCKSTRRLWPVIAVLYFTQAALAADIEPAKVQVVDKFGMNLASGQITHTLNTVGIGGAMGLAHNVSVSANEFNFIGYRGFQDKFYAKSRFVELNSTTPGYSPRKVLRIHDFGGSADFKIYVNGVLCESTCQATSNYYYVATGDERHTLEVNGAFVDWTKPDGTIARFSGGTNAANIGLLSQVIFPSGFTITIVTGQGVYTNTGFQLKYLYEADNRPFDKADNPSLINVPPASSSAASGWSAINPKYIDAINNSVDYCAPAAASCSYSRTWPRTTFNWPAGMPRTMFIGSSTAEVIDPLGRKTVYNFLARDLL